MNDGMRAEITRIAISLFVNEIRKANIIEAIPKLFPEIEGSSDVAMNGIEMYKSLIVAVDKAGGSTGWLSIDKLCKMTVLDLISSLAPNHIKFVFDKK